MWKKSNKTKTRQYVFVCFLQFLGWVQKFKKQRSDFFSFFFSLFLFVGKRKEREIFRLDSEWDSDSKSVLSLSWEQILSVLFVCCFFVYVYSNSVQSILLLHAGCYFWLALCGLFDTRFFVFVFFFIDGLATFPRSLKKKFFMGLLLFHQQINLVSLTRYECAWNKDVRTTNTCCSHGHDFCFCSVQRNSLPWALRTKPFRRFITCVKFVFSFFKVFWVHFVTGPFTGFLVLHFVVFLQTP